MTKFKLILTREALDTLAIFIDTVSRFMKEDLAVCSPADTNDTDLTKTWELTLQDSLREDGDTVLNLVNGREKGEEIVFDDAQAEAMLRLCSAIRLKMHQILPEDVMNYSLDTDANALPLLNEEQRRVWRASQFLAGFQDYILRQVDSELSDWSEDEV